MADNDSECNGMLEVLVFRRPDSEVARALSSALQRGSEALALCVIPSGKDSATIRLFWERQIQPEMPHVPLVIAHEAQMPVGELLPHLAEHLRQKNATRPVRFVLVEHASQSWGSLRLSLLVRRLRRRLDIVLHERREDTPGQGSSKHNGR